MIDLEKRFRDFDIWLQQPAGRLVTALESHAIGDFLPHLLSQHALLLASPLQRGLMDQVSMFYLQDRDSLLRGWGEMKSQERCHVSQDNSKDLIILPHTLEYVYDAGTLLQDTTRLLQPAGYVLVIGFNPFHPWVLWQQHKKDGHSRIPWGGALLRLSWIKNQLNRLQYDVLKIDKLFLGQSILQKMMGPAIYMVLARKRTVAMKPLRFYARLVQWAGFLKPMPKPEATRTASRHES